MYLQERKRGGTGARHQGRKDMLQPTIPFWSRKRNKEPGNLNSEVSHESDVVVPDRAVVWARPQGAIIAWPSERGETVLCVGGCCVPLLRCCRCCGTQTKRISSRATGGWSSSQNCCTAGLASTQNPTISTKDPFLLSTSSGTVL